MCINSGKAMGHKAGKCPRRHSVGCWQTRPATHFSFFFFFKQKKLAAVPALFLMNPHPELWLKRQQLIASPAEILGHERCLLEWHHIQNGSHSGCNPCCSWPRLFSPMRRQMMCPKAAVHHFGLCCSSPCWRGRGAAQSDAELHQE